MPKRSSRQTKSDDDSGSGLNLSLHTASQETDLSLHGPKNETDLSLHGTEHETDLSLHSSNLEAGSGVYADSQQRSGSRPPEAQSFEGHPNAPTNGLLQREAKDVRPGWVGEDTSTDVPEPVQDVLSSSGRSMSAPLQRDIEQKMGESFGDVRVHTGAKAAEACDAVNARAFTAGNHIVFNSGEYAPSTPEGEYIIAHEMAHVKQQTGGALSLLPQADSELKVDPDPSLEREADQAAKEALSEGDDPQIQSLPGTSTDVHIQRIPEGQPAYYEHVIDVIRQESDLEDEDIERIKDEVAQDVAGTDYDGAKGHDVLNVKVLQQAKQKAEQKAAKMQAAATLESEITDESRKTEKALAQSDMARGNDTSGNIDQLTDGERSAQDVLQEHAATEREHAELVEELDKLDTELQSVIADGDLRLTADQRAQLKSLEEELAEKIDSDAAQIVTTYITNLLVNDGGAQTLSGLLDETMGADEASLVAASVITGISLMLGMVARSMATEDSEVGDLGGAEEVDY